MKVYMSADIEGITGTTHWDETDKGKSDYAEFQEQMTAEVKAACEGALLAGAEEIWIKDAHASGRNIIASKLPIEAKLIRGWSEHPFSMVQELDDSFAALLLVGYHSAAGSPESPLAHTISGRASSIRINGKFASEFLLHAYAAALVNVPVVFLSGDAGICAEAAATIPNITTVAVKRGIGGSTINLHPQLAIDRIRQGVQKALESRMEMNTLSLPDHFQVEIKYKDHTHAFRSSFYPGARLESPGLITFATENAFEVLRMLAFTV